MFSPHFLYLLCFLEQLTVFKNRNETGHSFWIKMCLVTPKVLAIVVLWEKKKKQKRKFGDHIIGSKKCFYKFALMFQCTSIFL